jgi:tetratricopeptide (TPR) repeat protein
MAEEFELKRIAPDGIEAAIRRAEHYRLLNQPVQARSICHDVLAVEPDNERALIVLLLAMTDDFKAGTTSVSDAKEQADKLTDDYQRHYYNGIIAEREARALLTKGHSAAFAHGSFREAMEWFDKAAEIRPEGNDDAILRWNACVRTIRDENLRPRQPDPELGLE